LALPHRRNCTEHAEARDRQQRGQHAHQITKFPLQRVDLRCPLAAYTEQFRFSLTVGNVHSYH
jgi:hypothetical protein